MPVIEQRPKVERQPKGAAPPRLHGESRKQEKREGRTAYRQSVNRFKKSCRSTKKGGVRPRGVKQTPKVLGFQATLVVSPSGKRQMVKRPL